MTLDEAKKFVEDWQSSKTVKEVAAKQKRSVSSVQQTAKALRKKGVGLKTFRQNFGKLTSEDYDLLKSMV